MANGRVKWFNEVKGFGFIEAGDQDVFVHYSSLINANDLKTLPDGALVSFELVETDSGPQAKNVRILSPDEDMAV